MGSSGSSLLTKTRLETKGERGRETESAPSTPSIRSRISSIAHSSSKKIKRLSFQRKNASREQTRAFRDLICRWPASHVECLEKEFAASRILLRLHEEADLARPPVPSLGEQLLNASDIRLVFQEEECGVIGSILRARCDCLPPENEGVICFDNWFQGTDIKPHNLKQMIRFLCTDEWEGESALLEQLRSSLGCQRPLAEDLIRAKKVAETEGDLEIVLAFQSSPCSSSSELRVRVDSSVVAARSSVLRRLVQRREMVETELGTDTKRLVLDESLLPRAFLPLIIHFIYSDQLDMSLVSCDRPCTSSLSEVRALLSGRCPNASLQRAAHLVHLSRFLALDSLAYKCEEVLLRDATLSTCVPLLCWSLESGSAWLTRQLRSFIASDFSRLLHSPHLLDLPLSQLHHLLSSHFLQAAEVEVLEGVVRWGEHELLRRVEAREPNVVADTLDSVGRRGLSRAQLGGRELRALLAPIAALVRADYVLPPFHESVTSAYARGILERRGSLRDLVLCEQTAEIEPDLHWFAPSDDIPGPRLFLPYLQVISDRLRQLRVEKGEASAAPTVVSSRLSAPSIPLLPDASIRNVLPELLGDDDFQKASAAILSAIEKESGERDLASCLSRRFHRLMAIQLMALRVIRCLDVPEEAIEVLLNSSPNQGKEKEVPVQVKSEEECSLWPDLLPSATSPSTLSS